MIPSTTENAENSLWIFLKTKLKLESEESNSMTKWGNHVTLKARYSHRKYQMDIFCGIKESQKNIFWMYVKCLGSFEPITLPLEFYSKDLMKNAEKYMSRYLIYYYL